MHLGTKYLYLFIYLYEYTFYSTCSNHLVTEYLEVITEALRSQGSEACVSSIEAAMRGIADLLNSTAGVDRVSQLFKLVCLNMCYVQSHNIHNA